MSSSLFQAVSFTSDSLIFNFLSIYLDYLKILQGSPATGYTSKPTGFCQVQIKHQESTDVRQILNGRWNVIVATNAEWSKRGSSNYCLFMKNKLLRQILFFKLDSIK